MSETLPPPKPATLTRQANLERRNQALREAYFERYTKQKRPRIYTREYILAQLAQDYHLSIATVERLVLPKLS